jgi:KDO2-lipid IV(A) lauroyltransferase
MSITLETDRVAVEERTEPARPGRFSSAFRGALAVFWLRIFFCLAERAPRLMLRASRIISDLACRFSPAMRKGTLANARRILGPHSTPMQQERLARRVVHSFYLFCCDVGRSLRATPKELLDRIEWVAGHEGYLRAREQHRGVIVVTAHMGSFEVGMEALRAMEPIIHVVFRRDPIAQFERRRAQLRKRLDVVEAPIDDGWTIWMRLRDALLADQAVVLQGDRVLPGQKGRRVPFLSGHIELPTGPVKLALATGAPILPVFTIRMPCGEIRLFVDEPIYVDQTDSAADATDRAMLRFKCVLEKYIQAYPHQWLMLQPAWCEDQD